MVLLDCGEKNQLGDLYLLELGRGLESALVERGLGPVINATRDTLLEWTKSPRIQGVVLATGAERRTLCREFVARGKPTIVIDQSDPQVIDGVGWVILDLESGARDAGRMLVVYGHRRIGFIGNSNDDVVRCALLSEIEGRGALCPPELTVIAGRGIEAGAAAMRQILSVRERPTAVFARTDALALGAIEAAKDMGLRVPQDLSVMGHDDVTRAGTIGLTTVRIDCQAVGAAAAEALSDLLQGRSQTTVPVVRTEVVIRDSVAHPPERSIGRALSSSMSPRDDGSAPRL